MIWEVAIARYATKMITCANTVLLKWIRTFMFVGIALKKV